jgi:hypothetical protein
MNMNFLNQLGQGMGRGAGMLGDGLSELGSTMKAGYNGAQGFDLFGLGAGLRQGMADSGLSPTTINSLMTGGKWGLGLGALGALMGGPQAGLQGLGAGLLGGGLGSYIGQNKKKKSADDPYADLLNGGLFDFGDTESDPRNAQLMQGLQAAQALRPQFQSMPQYQPIQFQPAQIPTLGMRR